MGCVELSPPSSVSLVVLYVSCTSPQLGFHTLHSPHRRPSILLAPTQKKSAVVVASCCQSNSRHTHLHHAHGIYHIIPVAVFSYSCPHRTSFTPNPPVCISTVNQRPYIHNTPLLLLYFFRCLTNPISSYYLILLPYIHSPHAIHRFQKHTDGFFTFYHPSEAS